MNHRLQKLSALVLCIVMLIGVLLPANAQAKPKMVLHTFKAQSYLSPGVNIIAGDINGDNIVNSKDLIRFLKYLSGWSVTVNASPDILDVNGDGKINNKDLLRLLKFLSKWDVEIFPKVTVEKALFNAYDYLTNNQKGIYNILDENINILNKEHILLNDYYNAETFGSDVKVALEAIKNDRPECFWIPRVYYTCGTIYADDKLLEAYVSFADKDNPEKGFYAVTASEKEEMQAVLEAKVTEIVNAAKGLSTDFQKELYVHDYICQHASYDHYAEKAGMSVVGSLPWTVYGALINGNCVCEGYARAMQLICSRLGIDCGLATGKGRTTVDEQGNEFWEDHMWNIIELDGEIYYLDVTWDDGLETTLLENGLLTKNIHAYFNLTKARIQLDHIFDQKFNKETIYSGNDTFTFFNYDGDATLYNYYLYTGAYIDDENNIVSAAQFIMDGYSKGKTEFVIQYNNDINLKNAIGNLSDYLCNEFPSCNIMFGYFPLENEGILFINQFSISTD